MNQIFNNNIAISLMSMDKILLNLCTYIATCINMYFLTSYVAIDIAGKMFM